MPGSAGGGDRRRRRSAGPGAAGGERPVELLVEAPDLDVVGLQQVLLLREALFEAATFSVICPVVQEHPVVVLRELHLEGRQVLARHRALGGLRRGAAGHREHRHQPDDPSHESSRETCQI